jgi:hypothetical protein
MIRLPSASNRLSRADENKKVGMKVKNQINPTNCKVDKKYDTIDPLCTLRLREEVKS